jgi:hypothetical protein
VVVGESISTMDQLWKQAEFHWNNNRVLAWVLVLIGIALALWAGFFPQSPGVSIGLLAAAAGVMSLRPEMHPLEKFAWVIILVAFTILEVHAINVGDKKNEAILTTQKLAFQSIADGLASSITASKGQYDSTIKHVDGVLTTTQGVSSLTTKTLRNITGGNSYPRVIPGTNIPRAPHHASPNNSFTMTIENTGDEILSQVSVSIAKMLQDKWSTGGLMNPVSIGILSPHSRILLPRGTMHPEPGADGVDEYYIVITAQNWETVENLYFRKSKDGTGWAYKAVLNKRTWERNGQPVEAPLETIPWTEPQPSFDSVKRP